MAPDQPFAPQQEDWRYDRDYGYYGKSSREESLYGDHEDDGFMARIRQNPVPAALAGVGLTWLAFSGSNRGRYERAPERWRQRSGESWASPSEGRSTTERIGESASDVAAR